MVTHYYTTVEVPGTDGQYANMIPNPLKRPGPTELFPPFTNAHLVLFSRHYTGLPKDKSFITLMRRFNYYRVLKGLGAVEAISEGESFINAEVTWVECLW
jgi:hypothetical protein